MFVRKILPILLISKIVENSSTTCPRSLSVKIEQPIIITENGSIIDFYRPDLTYPIGHYWHDDDKTIYGCPCFSKTCIRRCCNNEEILNGSNCESTKTIPMLKFNDEQLAPKLRSMMKIDDAFYTIDNMICPSGFQYFLEPSNNPSKESFVILDNGHLKVANRYYFEAKDYCIVWAVRYQGPSVLICDSLTTTDPDIQNFVNYIGLCVSIVFLILALTVYANLIELRNIHGSNLMSYMSSLLIAYSLLVVVKFVRDVTDVQCICLGIVINFSLLASFFWLNVMCFDIWWTFGGFRGFQGGVHQTEHKKFIIYSIYAWGLSIALTVLCITLDFIPNVPQHLRPAFGEEKCWFADNLTKALYFYLPVGLTLFCNIILFVSTAWRIIKHKRETVHHLSSSESKRHNDTKQWFNLYLKLFVVMGINWSMEIVSWYFDKAPRDLWYLTDLFNTLQGFTIFLIFVCKKKIKRLLMKKFGFGKHNTSLKSSMQSSNLRTSAFTMSSRGDEQKS